LVASIQYSTDEDKLIDEGNGEGREVRRAGVDKAEKPAAWTFHGLSSSSSVPLTVSDAETWEHKRDGAGEDALEGRKTVISLTKSGSNSILAKSFCNWSEELQKGWVGIGLSVSGKEALALQLDCRLSSPQIKSSPDVFQTE
jgi:hypothetical protein